MEIDNYVREIGINLNSPFVPLTFEIDVTVWYTRETHNIDHVHVYTFLF